MKGLRKGQVSRISLNYSYITHNLTEACTERLNSAEKFYQGSDLHRQNDNCSYLLGIGMDVE